MDLLLRVRAEYSDAEKCRKELEKVERQMKSLNENSSAEEITRLTKRYAELSSAWENKISRIGKLGYYARDAFQGIAGVINRTNKEMMDTDTSNKTLLSTLTNRLRLEEKISEEVGKQKQDAESQLARSVEGYNRNAAKYQNLKQVKDKEYNGQAEGYWSKEDQALMQRGRDSMQKWQDDIDDKRAKVDTFTSILEASQSRIEEYKSKLSNIELPKLDLKTNVEDLEQQVKAGNERIDELKASWKSLNDELNERQDFQGAKDKMYSLFGDIQGKRKEIDELQQTIGSFNISGQIEQQQLLENYASELNEKVSQEEQAVARLRQQQDGLNEDTALYKNIQDEIDYHLSEKERYSQILDTTNESIKNAKALIDEETKAQTERQEKVKTLTSEIETLNAQYERQKDIVNDTDANQEAIATIRDEMKKTQDQIDATTDSTKALNDMLEQVGSAYEQTLNKEEGSYGGFAYTDTNSKAAKVYLNEDDYNRANELRSQGQELERALSQENLPIEDMQRMQEELRKVQEELAVLDDKARETADNLGGSFAQKVAQVTERLYASNQAVSEQTAEYERLQTQLESMKSLLEFQESSGQATQEQINNTKAEVDKLTESVNKAKDALSEARQEQADAQHEMNGLAGRLDMLNSSLVKAVGGVENFNKILSFMPGPIQKVVTGIFAMRNAAMSFLATPVGVTIMAIAAALYAVKKALDMVFLWFNKTAEGQMAYAKITGYLQGLLIRLNEIFINLGGTIFKVAKKVVQYIAQPKKAFQALLDFIGSQIKNRLKGFVDAFIGFGETIANVFVDLWESVKSGKLDFSETTKSAKKVLDGILAIGTGVDKVTDRIGNAVDATVEWFHRTGDVAKETSRLAQEEKLLGLEQEKNKKRQLEIQKTMLENMAIMRNTNASQEDRKKALEDYKKQLSEQIKIQKDFAEKRLDMQQRKMAVSPNTIEDYQEEARRQNEVLSADVAKQRGITSLARITNSINKQKGSKGKTKAQLREEYDLLLNEQAQKQAKQIRENGYTIEQARINALQEGNEKTIAQMKLNLKKELDAATEYENELTRQKIKTAREAFKKDPRNKKKTFDATTVDTSMTEQEKQVQQSMVSDAQNKYRQQIESMYRSYETMAERREKRERDYKAMMDFNAEQQLEKGKRLGELYAEGYDINKNEIDALEKEIDLLEQKGRLINVNNSAADEELKSMLTYLKEYGTFQQKKLAIAKEYAQKIAQAEAKGDTWEVKRLQKERDANTGKAKAEELAQGIDFTQLVSGVGTIVTALAKETYSKISDYKKTDEYKNSTPEQKQAIASLEKQVVDQGGAGAKSPFAWGGVTMAAEEYNASLEKVRQATMEHTRAIEQQETATKEYERALKELNSETDEAKKPFLAVKTQAAKEEKDKADKKAEETGKKQEQAKEESKDAGQQLQTELSAAQKGMQTFNKSLNDIASGSLSGFADGVSSVINQIAGKTDKASEGLIGLIGEKAGGIVGAIISVIDMLGDNPDQFVESILDGIAKVIEEVIAHIPEIIAAVVQGVGSILGGVVDGFGRLLGFGDLFGGADYSEYNAAREKYEQLSEIWDVLIDKKRAYLTESWGLEAQRAGEEALELLNAEREQARIVAQACLDAGASAGSHRIGYRMWEGSYTSNSRENAGYLNNGMLASSKDWDITWNDVNKAVERGIKEANLGDVHFNSMIDLLDMTSEQLEWIMKNYTGLWAHMDGDFKELLEDTMALGEREKEVLDQIREQILGTSKDAFLDSLLDPLYDFQSTTAQITDAISNNFAKMWNDMMINNAIKAKFQKQINDLYDEWYEMYKEGGDIDKGEQARIQSEIKSLMQQMVDVRNDLKSNGWLLDDNINTEQSATANSIQNISYDQADSLAGIMMSNTMAVEQSHDELTMLNATVEQIGNGMMETRDIAADSRDILAGMAIHVEEIRDSVVDTIVPRIKSIDDEITRIRRKVDEQ